MDNDGFFEPRKQEVVYSLTGVVLGTSTDLQGAGLNVVDRDYLERQRHGVMVGVLQDDIGRRYNSNETTPPLWIHAQDHELL